MAKKRKKRRKSKPASERSKYARPKPSRVRVEYLDRKINGSFMVKRRTLLAFNGICKEMYLDRNAVVQNMLSDFTREMRLSADDMDKLNGGIE